MLIGVRDLARYAENPNMAVSSHGRVISKKAVEIGSAEHQKAFGVKHGSRFFVVIIVVLLLQLFMQGYF